MFRWFNHSLRALAPVALVALAGAAGCGYTLQNSHNPLASDGVTRIYVAPLVNNTYRPGVENLVYNSLVRDIAAHGRVELTRRADTADAVLSGTVTEADSAPAAPAQASTLTPAGQGNPNIYVATSYVATLSCSFSLVRNRTVVGKKTGVIWSSSFTRSKPFPANNRIGVYGTTSALINDSEFGRALRDLADSMMDDVHESMLAEF